MRVPDQPLSGPAGIDPVQIAYANILRWVVVAGLVFMTVSFGLYVTGAVHSEVEVRRVPELWHLGTHELRDAVGGSTGWSWLSTRITGTSLAFAAVAYFPAAMAAVAAATAGLYRKRRQRAYTFFAIAEALVLALAASGLL